MALAAMVTLVVVIFVVVVAVAGYIISSTVEP